MKDHEDDVIQTIVEKSTVTVDSSAVDGIVSERLGGGVGKTEGFLVERDEGEDMMVDVVGSDVIEHSTGVNLDGEAGLEGLAEERMETETITHDLVLEKVSCSGEDVCDVSVGSRVLTFEKAEVIVNEEVVKKSVEVSKDVRQGNVVTTIASGSDDDVQKSGIAVQDFELHFESLNGEPQVGGGESSVTDSLELTERGLTDEVMEQQVSTVAEVAEGDCVMDKNALKEAETLDSSKITESSITTEKSCSQEVDRIVEGFTRKTETQDSVLVDPNLVCHNNQSSSNDVVNLEPGEVDERSKEDGQHPTTGVVTDDAKGHETVESLSREPQFIGEKPLIDKEEESERGLSEVMEQPMECDQEVADDNHVADEKIVNEYKDFDSSTISKPLATINPGSKDVDVVVVDQGLASKDEAQACVSVDSNPVCPDKRSLLIGVDDVNVHTDQQGEGSNLSIKESFRSKVEAIRNNEQIPENGTGIRDSKLAVESLSREPQFEGETGVIVREETERGLTINEEIAEQSAEFVQDHADADGVINEKDREGYEILDSSKIPESLTTVNLEPESVLPRKNEPESSIDQTIPAPANKVGEIDNEGQNHKVELPITDDMSGTLEDQGLKAEITSVKPSNDRFLFNSGDEVPSNGEMNGFQVSADAFEEVNGVTPSADVNKHDVLSEDLDFSYEDVHMERGEDAVMDIDEVLGWKDEMSGIDTSNGNAGCPEKDQHFKINGNSEADVCEQVEIGHQEENFKSREPIVYERRPHVEVPLYDALDGSRSPQLEDENLEVETDSEEDDEYVQEEERKVIEQSTGIDEVAKHLENESSVSLHQSRYFRPPVHEGRFSVSDLVWGKVRSHPWWPGQIINPSDASEKAMRYHKRDCFLVAYFGDGTFAWNDSAVLKPFRANFSQIHNHANLDSFKNAVRCALEEVSRRVELGLACSCVSQDVYEKIKYQVVENGGVRRKSMKRQCTDESASVSSFEPDKLVDYARLLAQSPGEGDNMELAMAKAQLSSYGRYKGYRQPAEFQPYGNMWEEASIPCEGVEQVTSPHEELKQVNNDGENASQKFENNLMDSGYPYKERSLSDLTDDAPYSGDGDGAEGGYITSKLISSSGSRKRKARNSISDGSVKRPNLHPEKVSAAVVSALMPSFKVGDRIRRVASQLSAPTKGEHGQHGDQVVGSAVPLEIPRNSQMEMIGEGKQESVAEMLSQLHLTAQDPMKDYSFLNTIIPFFYERRAAVFSKSLKQHSCISTPVNVKKRKASNENDPEEFEFDDVNDSYWTDRIIQNHSEEHPLQDNQDGGLEHQVVEYEPDKPAEARRRSNKKQKRLSNSDHEAEMSEDPEPDKPAKARRRSNKKQKQLSNSDHEAEMSEDPEPDKPAKARRRSNKKQQLSNSDHEAEMSEDPEPDKPAKARRRSNKKQKRLSNSDNETEMSEDPELDELRRQNLATEVILKFTEGVNFPSEIHLNKMFRRFGPLMESETEVDRQGGRARVVFKKCCDAEVAHGSAANFNIFGSINVKYELNYTPLVSYKPLPLPTPQDSMDGS